MTLKPSKPSFQSNTQTLKQSLLNPLNPLNPRLWYTMSVSCIRDLLTDICLFGAAASFAAYLALRYAQRIARASDWLVRVPRSRLAAFLAFALIATL